MAQILTRETLHQLVWAHPKSQLAYRLGITSAKLSKFCDILAVPTPPRGHWNTVKAGKMTVAPALPPHDGPVDIRIESERENAGINHGPSPEPAPRRTAVAPKYVTLDEWAQATFSQPPHKNTLFRWANEGRIQPQPRKIGRRWWVRPDAEYVAD